MEVYEPYFTQRTDCTGRQGLTSYPKVTAALRLLAYGSAADSVDEYVRIGEPTALECLDRFCEGMVFCFGEEYLRAPTEADLRKILARSEKRVFPGMIGSIDCAKWIWKNCPTAYHGQYQGKEGVAAMALECIGDDQLWIWHLFFGMPGSANYINVLESSTLSNKIANGTYKLPIEYEIAGETRSVPYWLADGIYPNWPCLVQTVSHPTSQKETLMANCQEAARKDVERAFGVLQAKWHILSRPSRFWYKRTMKKIMKCCVILHNMMVEHRMGLSETEESEYGNDFGGTVLEEGRPMWVTDVGDYDVVPPYGSIAAMCTISGFTNNHAEYFVTRELVMNHLWAKKGSE